MADIIKNLPTDSSTKEEVIQNVHINTPGSEEKIRKTLKKDEDRRKIIPYDNEDNNNVITINSIDNFRDISWINPIKIKKGFIYRSATPWEINEKELEIFASKLNIKTILDLRTSREISSTYEVEKNSLLLQKKSINIKRISLINSLYKAYSLFSKIDFYTMYMIIGGSIGIVSKEASTAAVMPWINEEGLSGMYEEMLFVFSDQICEILNVFIEQQQPEEEDNNFSSNNNDNNNIDNNNAGILPILIHCTSGKDRTGVVVALIQSILGCTDEEIMEDYNYTEEFFDILFTTKYQKHSGNSGAPHLQRAPKQTMQSLLNKIRERHGSITSYLVYIGFDEKKQKKLKELFQNNNQHSSSGGKL